MTTPRMFTSWLAPYFDGLVALRQASGASWVTQQRLLRGLDRYVCRVAPAPPLLRSTVLGYMGSLHQLAARSWASVLGVVWTAVGYALTHGAPGDPLGVRPRCPRAHSHCRAPRFVSREEIGTLLAAARRSHPADPLRGATLATLIGLLYITGLRISEALALDAGDLDPRERTLTVRKGKFGKSRILPLRESAFDALVRLLNHPLRPHPLDPSTPLFVSRGRRRLRPNSARIKIRTLGSSAHLIAPHPRPHDLRHTFAVNCVARWHATHRDVNTLLPLLSLTVERHASRNTVLAYRDSLKLFFVHAAAQTGSTPDQLGFDSLGPDMVRSFLVSLSTNRNSSPSTRNLRLFSIKAFAAFVALVAPEHLDRCRRIRDIRPARIDHPQVRDFDDDEMAQLVAAIDPLHPLRDYALLLLLYNTGARVSELVDLNLADVYLDPVPLVTLHGKGNKSRTCPIVGKTVDALRNYIAKRNDPNSPLFLNSRGLRLTRSGVTYILKQLLRRAGFQPRHTKRISPHVIRHTTAMHLLTHGEEIPSIAALLGHARLSTTQAYVEITLRMKQKAIASTANFPELGTPQFPDGDLLDFLCSLGKPTRYAQFPPLKPLPLLNRGAQLHITGHSP